MNYGATAIQTKENKTGLFLNTFDRTLVTSNTATSMQYVIGWTGNENLGADLWNTKPDDDLCVVAQTELFHSYVTDNNNDGISAVNQALITYIFRINNSNKSFFYNIELFDSRPNEKFSEFLMTQDGQDTTLPIVITLSPTNDVVSRYAHAVPKFGTKLQKFTQGILPQGTQIYGSCISRENMQNIIDDIKSARPDLNITQFTVDSLRLDTVIFGPEINTNPSNTYRENGNMGMRLDELTVYRLDNTIGTHKPILNFTVVETSSHSVTLQWQDNSTNESGFKIYKNNILIATLPENTTSYSIENLNSNTIYTFQIVSYNDIGNSNIESITLKTKDDYAWLIPAYHIILN